MVSLQFGKPKRSRYGNINTKLGVESKSTINRRHKKNSLRKSGDQNVTDGRSFRIPMLIQKDRGKFAYKLFYLLWYPENHPVKYSHVFMNDYRRDMDW
jgi:hypothetical protein